MSSVFVLTGASRTVPYSAAEVFCTSGIDYEVVVWQPGAQEQDLTEDWVQKRRGLNTLNKNSPKL